jgi:hypothetical protein
VPQIFKQHSFSAASLAASPDQRDAKTAISLLTRGIIIMRPMASRIKHLLTSIFLSQQHLFVHKKRDAKKTDGNSGDMTLGCSIKTGRICSLMPKKLTTFGVINSFCTKPSGI